MVLALSARLFFGVAGAIVLLGCSSTFDSVVNDGHCTDDDEVSYQDLVLGHSSCDGAKRAGDCASVGLPSAYGVDKGCSVPFQASGDTCRTRPAKLEGCVALGMYICCPP